MFTYNPDTKVLSKDGKEIGIFEAETGTVATTIVLAPAFKGQVKKLLADSGLEVLKFGKADDVEDDGDAKLDPPPSGLEASPSGCPPMEHTLGDKTPAVVEWYRDNQPEEFKRRYAGRNTHLSK